MRKLFFFISIVTLSLAVNAATININTETSDALRVALNSAADGDEIVMAAGTYVESNGGYIAFTGKHVTVKAAEGENVIIQPKVPVTIAEGGCAHFENVKFDVSKLTELASWYEHLIYPTDANTGNSMILDGCEIYGFTLNKSLLFCGSAYRLASVTINNCYFHNIMKSCLFIESTEAINISISNSTFANIETTTGSYWAGVIDTRATSGSFSVDHCTFYNVQVMSTDYAAIGKVKLASGAVVSNCIFAMPESTDELRAVRDVATANNCLTYNYTKDSGRGIHSDVARTNCIFADPLFTDAANGDFSYAGNWTTMSISPARYAGTDGSDLGDPRWYSAETLPTTSFASAYDLIGTKALLTGDIELNASDHIKYKGTSTPGTAKWKLHVGKSCVVSALVDVESGCTSGRQLTLTVKDADGNTVATLAQASATYNDADINLGSLIIPEEGDYTFILTNSTANSGAVLEKITLSYVGGAVQNMPGTTDVNEAWFSSKGTRADGMISFSSYTDQWVKWNIAVSGTGIKAYAFTLNINNPTAYGHNFSVSIYEDESDPAIATLSEHEWNSTYGEPLAIALEGVAWLEGGKNYVVKVTNAESGAQPKIISVSMAYSGGNVQNMPATTSINDAWYSNGGTRADGKIDFPDAHIQEGWVKWNVAFASAANYNVTVNIDNANGHNYTVALYRSESDESPITVSEGSQKSTIGTLDLGGMEVPAGSYIMKVTNATTNSDAKLISVTFAYAGGSAVDLSKDAPASLLANADAIVSSDWAIEGGKITHPESKATTGWAKWNVDCADYANYNVTVNISSDNGHLVRVEIFEDEAEPAIYTLNEAEASKYHTGDQAIDLGNIVLDNREYVVKVSNTVSSSHVQIASIVITYQNGARATLPASCSFEDLMLSAKAQIHEDMLYFEAPGDHNPVGQWAKWNVKAAAAGTFLFTMNVTSSNSQSYKISILDMEENVLDAFESGSLGSGDKEIKHYFNLAAGNYIVKLENTYAWSQGHVVSLDVTDPDPVGILTIDEAAENNSVLVAHDRDGNHDVQIIRTITSGMYNTICLPFDVNNTQLKNVFGSDVELKQLSSTEIEAGDFVLNMNFEEATSINRGTPYLIKTSRNVVNPIFADVEIKAVAGDATGSDYADFVGNFIAGTITASENNLFLGANNTLYFPTTNIEILGMRAYFQVHAPAGVSIRRARIIEPDKLPTDIQIVDGEIYPLHEALKIIENGQLIIIRDGLRYNAMGIRVE